MGYKGWVRSTSWMKKTLSSWLTTMIILGALTFIFSSAFDVKQRSQFLLVQQASTPDPPEMDRTVVTDIQSGLMAVPTRYLSTSSHGQQGNSQAEHRSKPGFVLKNIRDSESGTYGDFLREVFHTVKHERSRRDVQTDSAQLSPENNPRPRRPIQNNPQNNPKPPPVENNTTCHLAGGHNAETQFLWTESQADCSRWLLSVPTGNGVVFTFNSVKMFNGLELLIQEVDDRTQSRKIPPLWKFLDKNGNNFMAPLLVRRNQVLLEVKQPPTKPHRRTLRPSASVSKSASFNLSYIAHPLTFIPPEVDADDSDGFRTSSVMYNCSRHPKEIPRALQCDMIQQCVDGEDEEGCSYKSPSCGDWIPYGDGCLRAFFKPTTNLTQTRSHITMPIPADKICTDMFHATLALLPDAFGIELTAKILQHSGYHSATVGLRKMRPRSHKLKQIYKYVWQWGKRGSPVAYEQVQIQKNNPITDCAVFDLTVDSYLQPLHCTAAPSRVSVPEGFICTKGPQRSKKQLHSLHLPLSMKREIGFPTKSCPDGSLVQTFHTCDWHKLSGLRPPDSSIFPAFKCLLGQSIHYTFVCDAVDDCADGSDEISCMAPKLTSLPEKRFICTNLQAIPEAKQCNGINDCFDNSDEEDCIKCRDKTELCPSQGCIPKRYKDYFESCEVPPKPNAPSQHRVFSLVSVELDGFGMSSLKALRNECKEGYFQCDENLCIPMFLLNNGEQDCPNGLDEDIPNENFTCPGYYRCHLYGNCIHSKHLCDGIPHCPEKDDERYCDLSCPPNCACEGYAYKCQAMFDPLQHLNTRYLDISGVIQPDLKNISRMELLFFLNLSYCRLEYVNLTNMPQLQILDLSYNMLEDLSSVSFSELTGLKYLSLSNNPLTRSIDSTFTLFITISGMVHLKELLLVNTGLQSIEDNTLAPLPELIDLDLRQNDITRFDRNVFSGLLHLKTLHTDEYKLCCPYFHDVPILECHAPKDELSSCDDLLSNKFYQVSVWILAAFNIPANVAVLVYRLWEIKMKRSKSYTVLVASLCLSDLLMGIYLVFIGSADVHYRNVWVSKENEWTGSEICKFAGILAFLSSEVSAFVVCLITLERLLVMCFPLRRQFHLTSRSAGVACALIWLLGLLLATVPTMAGWELYGQNGFCLPLPITRTEFPGQDYIFAVFIYVNFVLFILIGAGQICIYKAITSVGLSSSSSRKQRDTTIARRLMLITFTDFLCWFPIGLMGMLSSMGTLISGEVNVLAALFILPFNSSLNPHLYTFNSLLDQYRERRMDRRIQKTIYKIHTEIARWPADKVESLLKSCLQTRVIQNKKILLWMKLENSPEENEELELEIAKGCDEDTRSDEQLTIHSHAESDLCT